MPHPFEILLALLGREAQEEVSVCTMAPGPGAVMSTEWVAAGRAGGAVQAHAGTRHVWYGVQPMNRPDRGRGCTRDVSAVRCLYADLDHEHPGKVGGMAPSTARAVVDGLGEAIGTPPHAVVSSGHGLQPYWVLEPVEPLDGALLLLRWRALVVAVAARHGASVDTGVYDLPRILRVPGPPNLKWGTAAPTGLEVIHQGSPLSMDACMKSIDEALGIDEGLIGAQAARPVGGGQRAGGQRGDGRPRATARREDRAFSAEQATEFLTAHAFDRVRETGWGVGGDFWRVVWEAAMVCGHFVGMYEEEDLKDMLRAAIRDGHEGCETDCADEYQIARGLAVEPDWTARAAVANPFGAPADVAAAVGAQGGVRLAAAFREATDGCGTTGEGGENVAQDYVFVTGGKKDDPVVTPRAAAVNPFARTAPHAQRPVVPEVAHRPGRHLVVRRACDITPESCDWLWEHTGDRWIPLGGLVLLGGRESVGKSSWAARLVAQVTNGKMAGEFEGRPKSVVISATEDAWPQTVVPRLMAAGADLGRILQVQTVDEGVTGGLTLPHDVPALRKLITEQDVALVVLDPLLSTVGRPLDTHKDSDVRKALEPLVLLANASRATFIGLIHQNKGQSGDLLTRMMGSRAFSAVARAVLVCAPGEDPAACGAFDPLAGDAAGQNGGAADKKNDRSDRYLLGQLKSNLGPRVKTSISYELISVVVGNDAVTGKPIRTSKVDVVDYRNPAGVEETVMAKEQAATVRRDRRRKPEGSATDRCGTWLRTTLAGGPMLGAEVKLLASANGYHPSTLKAAAVTVGVRTSGSYHNPDWALSGP